MKVSWAKYSGFCFGVRRAVEIAKESARSYKNVYIKGDLVHNERVCEEIEKKGIKTVDSLYAIPKNSLLIIKAHGEPLKTYQEAESRNLKIIDATCPMVKDIHKKAKSLENKGYQVVIIGDKNHQETIGILGNIKEGIAVENKKEVEKLKLGKKIGVVCQSTQNIENVKKIISRLKKITKELIFINTICQPTRNRQKEVEKLSLRYEAILVVGSKKSANTKRLYAIAKKINKDTFWISNPQKIKKGKFLKFKSLGIIGGASTPQKILGEIYQKLR